MPTSVTITCASTARSGVTLQISAAQVYLSAPMDHATALVVAGQILAAARVTRAEFEHGYLRELG